MTFLLFFSAVNISVVFGRFEVTNSLGASDMKKRTIDKKL